MRRNKTIYGLIAVSCMILLWVIGTYRVTIAEDKTDSEQSKAAPFNLPGTEEVDSWTRFRTAFNDPDVDTIVLTGDVTRTGTGNDTDLNPLERDLTIMGESGEDWMLSFGSASSDGNKIRLGSVSAATTLRIENLTYTFNATNRNLIDIKISAGNNWTVELCDVTSAATGNNAPCISGTDITVPQTTYRLSGENNLISSVSSESTSGTQQFYGIYGNEIIVESGITNISHNIGRVASSNNTAAGYGMYVRDTLTVKEGAVLNVTAARYGNRDAAAVRTGTLELEKGAECIIEMDGMNTEASSGTSAAYGIYNLSDLYVGESAQLKVKGTGNTASMIHYSNTGSSNKSLLTEKGSQLEVVNEGTSLSVNGFDNAWNACGIYGGITDLTISGGSTVEVKSTATAFRALGNFNALITEQVWENGVPGTQEAETNVTFSSEKGNGFQVFNSSVYYPSTYNGSYEVKINVHGEGAKIKIAGGREATSNTGATYTYAFHVAAGGGSEMKLTKGSYVEVEHTDRGSGMYFGNDSYQIIVEDESVLNINVFEDGFSGSGNGMRFSYATDSEIIIDNGEVNIHQKTADSSVGRLDGNGLSLSDDNLLEVKNGGKLNVILEGSQGEAKGGIGNGVGLYFNAATDRVYTNKYYVDGEGSEINIQAAKGSAIANYGGNRYFISNIDIKVTNGGSLSAVGNPPEGTGVFNTSYGILKMLVEDAAYFDFVYTGSDNRKMSGLFTCQPGSELTIKNSRLAFWEKGKDIHGMADLRVKEVEEVVITGENLGGTPSPAIEGYTTMTDYARVNASNMLAQVDEIWLPTNADQHLYVYMTVAEGYTGATREAWTDEAGITLDLKSKNQTFSLEGKTVGIVKDAETGEIDEDHPGVEVYGEEAAGGIVAFDLTEEDGFEGWLDEGDEIKITGSWHGEEKTYELATSTPEIRDENPECTYSEKIRDKDSGEFVIFKTKDVIPPDGIAQNEVNYNKTDGVYEQGRVKAQLDVPLPVINDEAAKISGKIKEGSALYEEVQKYADKMTVNVYIEDELVTAAKGRIAADGSWEADISDSSIELKPDEELAISISNKAYDDRNIITEDDVMPQDYKRLSHAGEYQETKYDYIEQMGILRDGGYEAPKKTWEKLKDGEEHTLESRKISFHDRTYTSRLKFIIAEAEKIEIVEEFYLIAPKTINLGEEKENKVYQIGAAVERNLITNNMMTFREEEEIQSFGIVDTRLDKKEWTVQAKILKPAEDSEYHGQMKHEDGDAWLNDVLVYHNGSSDESLGQEAVIVARQTEENKEEDFVDIVDEWKEEKKGLYFVTKPQQIKRGKYTAKIEWTLMNVP